ncbi:hypothetical protein SEA_ROOTS515_241 [Mycobacterium phage Roots515]|nr:hypothetical protein SEA_ROOTS515_241 [Mycobacterium phage Roots515]
MGGTYLMGNVDPALADRITAIIGKHSLLDPEAAATLAHHVAHDLGLTSEVHQVQGMDHLGGVTIKRWVTGWFKG